MTDIWEEQNRFEIWVKIEIAALEAMEPLEEGEECKVVLKTLGEYLVKIHLAGGQKVGLRLAVVKR